MDENDELLARKRKKSRSFRIKLIIALLIVGGIVAWYLISKSKRSIVFETQPISKGQIEAVVSATGNLSAVTTVDVGSQVSGIIEVVDVDFNDRVHKGQVLARIDPSLYLTQLEKAQASLQSARAQFDVTESDLQKARIGVADAEAGVYQAQAQVQKALADLENSRGQLFNARANLSRTNAQLANDKTEYNRALQLFKQEFISKSDRDRAYTTYQVSLANSQAAQAQIRSAQAAVRAAESNVASARANYNAAVTQRSAAVTGVTSAAARVTSARASIQQAESDIAQVKVNLDRCIIRSPIDGIVIDRKVEPGQTVAASFQAPVLFVLAKNLKNMEVNAVVDEADIGRISEGQEVSFTVDAFPEDKFKGKIFQVRTNPNVDQNVVTYTVIIRTDNEDLKLKPGMTANIDITTEVKKDIIRIPNAALRFRPDRIPGFPMPKEDKENGARGNNRGQGSGSPGQGPRPKQDSSSPASPSPSPSGQAVTPAQNGAPEKGQRDERNKNLSSVWVLENNTPKKYMVELGISDNVYTEMKKGDLKEGMETIVDATAPGAKVTPGAGGPPGSSPSGGQRQGGGRGGNRNVRVRL